MIGDLIAPPECRKGRSRSRYARERISILLFLLIACGQSDGGIDNRETKQTYSLCPKTDDSRQRLYEQVKAFAGQQKAGFIDRGAGAQQELSSMQSDVLSKTGGSPILLTVEKPEKFRISVTNLGLREKIALTVRSWGESGEGSPVAGFMEGLGRFWVIQGAEGGITDDPPCVQVL